MLLNRSSDINEKWFEFSRETGIFYHHNEGAPFLDQNLHFIPVARYNWTIAFIQICQAILKHVTMTDPRGAIGFHFWETMKWELPAEIAWLCEHKGLKLDVNFNFSKPGSEIETWDTKWEGMPCRTGVHHLMFAEWEFN